MDALCSTVKRDLVVLANPPAWFRFIILVLLRIEAAFGGSMMRHGLGRKAQIRARRCLAALDSMTEEERIRPDVIDYRRIERIARGSGTTPYDAQLAVFHLLFQRRRMASQRD